MLNLYSVLRTKGGAFLKLFHVIFTTDLQGFISSKIQTRNPKPRKGLSCLRQSWDLNPRTCAFSHPSLLLQTFS